MSGFDRFHQQTRLIINSHRFTAHFCDKIIPLRRKQLCKPHSTVKLAVFFDFIPSLHTAFALATGGTLAAGFGSFPLIGRLDGLSLTKRRWSGVFGGPGMTGNSC